MREYEALCALYVHVRLALALPHLGTERKLLND